MKLSAPKQTTFIVAVVLAVLALLGALITIPVLTEVAVWLALVAFVVLALGVWLEGL